jgi:hypothetical protein
VIGITVAAIGFSIAKHAVKKRQRRQLMLRRD